MFDFAGRLHRVSKGWLVDKRTDAVLAGDLQQLGPIVNLKSENALDGRARLMQEHR